MGGRVDERQGGQGRGSNVGGKAGGKLSLCLTVGISETKGRTGYIF